MGFFENDDVIVLKMLCVDREIIKNGNSFCVFKWNGYVWMYKSDLKILWGDGEFLKNGKKIFVVLNENR